MPATRPLNMAGPLLVALLVIALLGCGPGPSISPDASNPADKQLAVGGFPCDLEGNCPGPLVCDSETQLCIPGNRPPYECPVLIDRQAVLNGKGLQCVWPKASTLADVVRLLGPPDWEDEYRLSYPQMHGVYYSRTYGLSFQVWGEDEQRPRGDWEVTYIYAVAPFVGATPEGVCLGMSRVEVHQKLGSASSVSEDGLADRYTCRGFNLYYDESDLLIRFQLFTHSGC